MSRVTRKSNGVTLIELIISIAILALLVITFSGMFTSGIKTILISGNRSDKDYEVQKVIEGKIISPTPGVDGNVVTTVENTEIKIKFNSKEIRVPGKAVKSEFDGGKSNVVFTTFVPD